MGWQWHQLDHVQISCTSLQRDDHTSTSSLNVLQAGCSSWCLATSFKALEAGLKHLQLCVFFSAGSCRLVSWSLTWFLQVLQQVDIQRKVHGGKAKSFSLLCILKLSKAQLNTKAYRVSDFIHDTSDVTAYVSLWWPLQRKWSYQGPDCSLSATVLSMPLLLISGTVYLRQWPLLKRPIALRNI